MTKPKSKTTVKPSDKKQIPVRLDSKTFLALEELSEKEKRSVNGQIEYLLENNSKGKRVIGLNTMEITKEDRMLLKELIQKFEKQETLSETQREILVGYYESEVIRKEQDVKDIKEEINSYNDKLRKLNLKKESEKVSA